MTSKEYLSQIKKFDVIIENKIETIKTLRELSRCCKAVSLDDRVQTSGNNDLVGNSVVRILELERELNNDIDRYVDIKREASSKLDKLTNANYIDILYKKYFLGQSLLTIAYEKNYSYQHMRRMHGWALQEFEKVM